MTTPNERSTVARIARGTALGAVTASLVGGAIAVQPALAAATPANALPQAHAPKAHHTHGAQRSPGVLSGKRAPNRRIGIVGDFYINTKASTIYGPKTAKGWGKATSLRGSTGASGEGGASGATGVTGPVGPTGIGSSVPVVHLGYNTTVIHTNRIFSAVGFCPSDQMIAIGAMWSLTTPTGPPTDINTPLQIWSSGIALDVSGNPGAAWELRGVYAFPSGNDGPDLELILQPICIDATLVPAT